MTTGQASQLAAIEAAQAKEKTSGSNSSEDRAPTRQKRGNLATVGCHSPHFQSLPGIHAWAPCWSLRKSR